MWLDRLKELKEQTGLSNKTIAEKTFSSEKTIHRIFTGENDNPYIDTLDRIAKALGSTLDYIFSDTKVVIGEQNLATLQENLAVVEAERDMVLAENAVLKEKVSALTAENNLLSLQLKHKEEIVAIHNYYLKLNTSETKE